MSTIAEQLQEAGNGNYNPSELSKLLLEASSRIVILEQELFRAWNALNEIRHDAVAGEKRAANILNLVSSRDRRRSPLRRSAD